MTEDRVPGGNAYDKHGTRNPVARRLVRGFDRAVDELVDSASPASILDVGCGEGHAAARWARRYPAARVVAVDPADDRLQKSWSRLACPNLDFQSSDAASLPFATSSFDLVTGLEVLEHLRDPRAALAEMRRCAARRIVVSVPREPLWRGLNLLRGAYWRDSGNSPGHLHHWSRRAFVALAGEHGHVAAVRSPLPWTVVAIDV